VLDITRSPLTVGRRPDCNYVLDCPTCSNLHFRIYSTVFEEGRTKPLIYCEDLQSTNGTYVNNRRLEDGASVLLLPGDIIEIKDAVCFEFRIDDPQSSTVLDEVSEREKYVYEDFYTLTNQLLGEGGYGIVCLACEKATGKQVACKIVDLKRLEQLAKNKEKQMETRTIAIREARILSKLRHPNIVDVRRVFVTTNRVYLFQELVTCGDLFSFVAERPGRALSEIDTMTIVWQILQGLAYLHENNVVHRDLKPENILCTSKEIGSRIILADFGTARFMNVATRLKSIHGTLEFAAPEMLRPAKCGYSSSVDLWSLGVIVHQLLSGLPPFQHRDNSQCKHQMKELTDSIMNPDLNHMVTEAVWKDISNYAKDFVRNLICVDQKKRLSAKEAIKHPWLARHSTELHALCERANRGWKERGGEAVIEEWQTPSTPLPQSQAQEVIEQKLVLESDLEIDQCDDMESQPPPLEPEYEENLYFNDSLRVPADQSPPPSLDDDNESTHSLQDQDIYDSVVLDGALRSVEEFYREVEERKAEKARSLFAIADNMMEESFVELDLDL
ncbi:kinase-like domain-containing protein, partial [Geopyxis carbonaria]